MEALAQINDGLEEMKAINAFLEPAGKIFLTKTDNRKHPGYELDASICDTVRTKLVRKKEKMVKDLEKMSAKFRIELAGEDRDIMNLGLELSSVADIEDPDSIGAEEGAVPETDPQEDGGEKNLPEELCSNDFRILSGEQAE